MKKKSFNYFLGKIAALFLIVAQVSITQCSVAALFQIPVDNKLKQKIFKCRAKTF